LHLVPRLIKSEWSYTCTPPIYRNGADRDFTFYHHGPIKTNTVFSSADPVCHVTRVTHHTDKPKYLSSSKDCHRIPKRHVRSLAVHFVPSSVPNVRTVQSSQELPHQPSARGGGTGSENEKKTRCSIVLATWPIPRHRLLSHPSPFILH
jgi:hypothetical protein